MIAAVSQNGVIGQNNDIPWKGRYPADFKFFRQMTTGGEVIMGRRTFESMNNKPLPKRNNIVITRQEKLDGVQCFSSLKSWAQSRALILEDVATTKWIIGGANIYREAMQLEDLREIYLTLIPEVINGENLVFFPWINPLVFQVADDFISLPDSDLKAVLYTRI